MAPIWTQGRVPRGFWKLKKNRLMYLRWLGKTIGYKRPDDWYEVTKKDFANNSGGGLLANCYKGSYIKALEELYPDKKWFPWLFGHQRNTWTDPKIRRTYLDWLAARLDYTTLDDWYDITEKEFFSNHGYGLLAQYRNSPATAVIANLPRKHWHRWRFTLPKGYWKKKANRQEFYAAFLKRHRIATAQKLKDWVLSSYQIQRDSEGKIKTGVRDRRGSFTACIGDFGGHSLLAHFNTTVKLVCEDIYPNENWSDVPTRVTDSWVYRPQGHWDDLENRKTFLKETAERLKIRQKEDWYKVAQNSLNGGSGLLKLYEHDHIRLITDILPELGLVKFLFVHKPRKFFDDNNNAKEFFLWLLKEQKHKSLTDLQRLHLWGLCKRYHAIPLAKRFHSSMYEAFVVLFPEEEWDFFQFKQPDNYFRKRERKHKFVHELGKRLGYKGPSDWYRIRRGHFFRVPNGRRILKAYNGSISAAIKDTFPEVDWKEWLFERVSRSFWRRKENQRRAINWLFEEVLLLSDPKDFYVLTERDFVKNSISGLLANNNGSYIQAIVSNHPELELVPEFFQKIGVYAIRLHRILVLMYPEISFAAHGAQHPTICRKTGSRLSLDIYCPEIRFAIEYQGTQHNISMPDSWGGDEAFRAQKQRDAEKRRLCKKNGIDLLEIYEKEWDGSPYTIKSLLTNTRLGKFGDFEARLQNLIGKRLSLDEAPWAGEHQTKRVKQSRISRRDFWDDRLLELQEFQTTFGHCLVKDKDPERPLLANWIQNQRSRYKRGTLEKKRVELLEEVDGWVWIVATSQWTATFELLEKYTAEHGTSLVQQGVVYEETNLGSWVSTQRQYYKKKKLTRDQIELLEGLTKWTWTPKKGPK
jgi:hypothetical protein